MAQRNGEIVYEVIEDIGVLSTNQATNWSTRLRRVLWNYENTKENQDKIKFDIRAWSSPSDSSDPDDNSEVRMSRGLTLTTEEAKQLSKLLSAYFAK